MTNAGQEKEPTTARLPPLAERYGLDKALVHKLVEPAAADAVESLHVLPAAKLGLAVFRNYSKNWSSRLFSLQLLFNFHARKMQSNSYGKSRD